MAPLRWIYRSEVKYLLRAVGCAQQGTALSVIEILSFRSFSAGVVESRNRVQFFMQPRVRERNACDVSAKTQKSLLQHDVASLWIEAAICSMMEIATAYFRAAIVADRKPRLCFVSFLKIIRCPAATHSCRDPTGIDCVRENISPFACHCHTKDYHMQL